MRVLVSRTDRIGDVVLTLPLCALLTEKLGAEVIALSQEYCRPVFEACPHISEVLQWDAVEKRGRAQRDLLANCHADVVLHVYPRIAIANAALAARIPLRIGTSHRWYHWATCNELEHYSRKRSALHEAQLNIRLARRLLGDVAPSMESLARLTTLQPRTQLPREVEKLLDPSLTMVVLHPGSGGSGREWPLDRWHDLAWSLEAESFQFLISGSQTERLALEPWLATLPPHAVDIMGRLDLAELIALLARVDGIVAASTGPLHVAAALGRHALGLYPPTPPMHPGRWAPLGPRAEYLAAAEPCDAHAASVSPPELGCECMRGITVDAVKARVLLWRRAMSVERSLNG
jgi:ADP-heptose:LPS heptosyltransferase